MQHVRRDQPEKQPYTLLIIDDDPLVNSSLHSVLSESFDTVLTFTDPAEALEQLDTIRPDLILLDIFLGNINGLDILAQLREREANIPVIMITAFSDIKLAVRAIKLGAEDFIVKPPDLEQLEITIRKVLQNYELRRRVELLQAQLPESPAAEILGESPAIQEVIRLARIYAQTDDTTVLITGETGTGKELVARFIHKHSRRASGPFIAVNCGAIPRDLAESELFGYERGAFTGAVEKLKKGKFELAHRGTIFLDEIGELPLDLQVKLLRILQEKRFYRLGGEKEVSTDVRVIAATNQNLEELVAAGKFREDLYYRINVARIEIPPLRERKEDILLLASAFVQEFNEKMGKKVKGFTPEAVQILRQYEWKGNVRELRNVIERVMLLTTDTVIDQEALRFLPSYEPSSGTDHQATELPKSYELAPGEHRLIISPQGANYYNVLRDLFIQTLRLTKGNKMKAAEMLGITRARFRYRLEQLNITEDMYMPRQESVS